MEANKALLKSRFLRWQLAGQSFSISGHIFQKGEFHYTSSPLWQIQTTEYEINNLLPSSNGWKQKIEESEKNKFHYLTVAISENKCKSLKISQREYNHLYIIRSMNEEGISSINHLMTDGKISDRWLQKMCKLGVLLKVLQPEILIKQEINQREN